MSEQDYKWEEIEKTRNSMLTKSDWTQIPDVNLDYSCILEWRKWRTQLRKVDRVNFGDHEKSKALSLLKELNENKPAIVYSKTEKHGNTVNRSEVYEIVTELMEKSMRDKQEPTIDDCATLEEAKEFAMSKLDKMLDEKLEECSPAKPHTFSYYEKVQEAIDYFSKSGTKFPLLENMAEADGSTLENVATRWLKLHNKAISEILKVEKGYFNALKRAEKAVTIQELRDIIEEYNGY